MQSVVVVDIGRELVAQAIAQVGFVVVGLFVVVVDVTEGVY